MRNVRILSWNIQYGKGADEVIDFNRIRSSVEVVARELPDVICLQEVSRGYPELAQEGESDQLVILTRYFPGYRVVYGAAVDRWEAGRGRTRFGNAILSRMPLLECFRHSLPMPLETGIKGCMSRQALEVILDISGLPLRLVTTHLEYFATTQRQAQARYLAHRHKGWMQVARPHPGNDTGLFRRSICPGETILCGDFNERVDDPAYRILTETEFVDAWRHLYPGRSHTPTCGVHDQKQWQEGPHCRDYFFLSRGHRRIQAVSLEVDQFADASDHQPLLLEIAIG